MNQIVNQGVDRRDGLLPGAGNVAEGGTLIQLTFFAHVSTHMGQLVDHAVEHFDHIIERVGDFAFDPGPLHRQPN